MSEAPVQKPPALETHPVFDEISDWEPDPDREAVRTYELLFGLYPTDRTPHDADGVVIESGVRRPPPDSEDKGHEEQP